MELYNDDLEGLMQALGHLEDLSNIPNVFAVEIKLKFDDTNDWVVVGWGEAGDPCVLRFEKDERIAPVIPFVPGGFIKRDPQFPYTINKGDYNESV